MGGNVIVSLEILERKVKEGATGGLGLMALNLALVLYGREAETMA